MKTTATIDSLDPRTALVTILVISTLSIIISDPFWLLGLFVLTIGLLIYFNLDGRQIYDKIRKFIPLLLFLLVIQSIFSPSGTAILKIGTIPLITTGGIIKGLVIILRMMIIIFSAMPLLLFDSMKLVLGLIRFRIPYEIAFMALLAIRFLPVFVEEFRDVITAIQLRGIDLKKIPFRDKKDIYIGIFMPVVASAILKAKKTALAMETRAFRAYPERTYIEDISFRKRDIMIIVLALIGGTIYGTAYFIWR